MAASAQSLYRKHRPRSFADVVGQDAVVRTLRHAVERDKVHHAYLFVGSRGTGKTSMAKILASCLNCGGDGAAHQGGPTIDPCGQCDSCRSIASATSLDVIEMDAASNNSVDDIRELRESVAFAPVSGRHKVYILDEAHMLSQAAWNAFLKTLEEPPPSTVFVLATTEASKVPATVVDRCHRFDFQRPSVEQIASVVMRAAQAESIEIPPPAVAAIARAATGSFRDALGTLEQLVTYSGTRIELDDVLAVLGVADEQLLADAFDAVAHGDARNALLTVARCIDGGRDAGSFTRDLEGRARELLVVQTLGDVPPELSLTPEIDERLRAQAQRISRAEVVRVLDLLGAALEAVRAGADPRTQLELALVKGATPQADGSLPALLARIERLERGIGPQVPATSPAPPSQPSPVAQSAPTGQHAPTMQSAPVAASASTPPAPSANHQPTPMPALAHAREQPQEPPAPEGAARGGTARAPGEATEKIMRGEARGGAMPGEATQRDTGEVMPEEARGEATLRDAREAPPGKAMPGEAPEGSAPATTVVAIPADDDLNSLWPAVLESVRAQHKLLRAFFSEAVPLEITDTHMTVAFPVSAAFNKRKAEEPDNRKILLDALNALTGRRYSVSFELSEDASSAVSLDHAELSEEEIVARLMSELDAEELSPEPLAQQKGGE